ncbi:ABC transporter permease subunit [Streptomyces sp. BH-SS-21]|uniref:ABC transporter permease subunit n=1 Tax=Streptomyces liliiviolaceus TaxID=2823109 RepID=A0A941BCL9_9ACTN|nr:ABC transporter permease subunit [Streptomyces liliiviolaceus]MBQ0854877.1 ABC transporter permease subunit [Streptomyces liliiviolaceus]
MKVLDATRPTKAPAAPPPRVRRPRPRIAPLVGIAVAALIAELVPRTGLIADGALPPLSSVLAQLGREAGDGALWEALGNTVRTWAVGLVAAVAAGVIAGVAIGLVPVLRAITASTVEFLRPIPSVALIPAVILVFGTGYESGVVLIVYAGFWQVLVQVLYGVQDIDPVAHDTARSYRFGLWARIRHVIWPTALPFVFTGIRLAASVALVLAITGELVIGTPGIGQLISVAQSSGATTEMFALVLLTGVLGVLVNVGFRYAERAALGWHPSVRRSAGSR